MSRWLVPVLSPHGVLRLEPVDNEFPLDEAVADRLEKHFARDSGHGLLQLGVGEAGSNLSPALAWWRAFAMRFVAALCTRDDADKANVRALPVQELAALIDEAPPM